MKMPLNIGASRPQWRGRHGSRRIPPGLSSSLCMTAWATFSAVTRNDRWPVMFAMDTSAPMSIPWLYVQLGELSLGLQFAVSPSATRWERLSMPLWENHAHSLSAHLAYRVSPGIASCSRIASRRNSSLVMAFLYGQYLLQSTPPPQAWVQPPAIAAKTDSARRRYALLPVSS